MLRAAHFEDSGAIEAAKMSEVGVENFGLFGDFEGAGGGLREVEEVVALSAGFGAGGENGEEKRGVY